MFLVPTLYRMLADEAAWADTDFSGIRLAACGGAPCPPALVAQWQGRGVGLRQGFGMTEAGVNCFALGEPGAVATDIVGAPLPGVRAEVRRADGANCAPDEVGELHLAGDMVCAGYFERDDEWRRVFRDGWLATGDLASVDAQGVYRIRGRLKEMYIRGGQNVYPLEVEAALASCDGVAECAVFGAPDAHWGECGVAAVVPRRGAAVDAESLRRQLREVLAAYKLPSAFWLLDALPRLPSGKLARAELQTRWHQRAAA